jgi:hypothetical protein
MRLMQVGGKPDEVSWDIYDICRKYGAIIATGHEHSYARSLLMSDFRTQTIANTDKNAPLELSPGKTFAFVSGIAGFDIRPFRDNLQNNPWWASAQSLDVTN